MSFEQLALDRYSVRDFSAKKIDPEIIDQILEAGRLSPTARNVQPQTVYVLESDSAVARIREITRCAYNAPVVLVVCGKDELAWKNPFSGTDMLPMDLGIVTTQMMYRAWELGVGSCWVCYFDPAAVKEAFNIPEGETPYCLLPIGYAADGCKPSDMHFNRKPLSETVKHI